MSRYDVIEVIGRGATSIVYRAHDTLLDRAVALKEVTFQDAGDLAIAEARAVARISHPNVVIVHDVFIEENRRLIAMELLDGPTLRMMLDSERSLGFDRALAVAQQVAGSLAAAHAAGVVHRDIKPDNIFVVRGGSRVVVSDFGMALATLRGGTPGYMAPEQWRDEPAGPPADVFAWACVIVECLTGVALFGIDEHEARARTLAGGPIPSLGWPALEQIVRVCLDLNPSRRPRNGSELLAALEGLGGLTTVPSPGGTIAPFAETRRALPIPVAPPSSGDSLGLLIYPGDGQPPWRLVVDAAMGSLEFGREAEIPIIDSMVSRRHARLELTHMGWTVTDLGSLNGTVKNGQPISQTIVDDGDVLTFGSTVVRIERA